MSDGINEYIASLESRAEKAEAALREIDKELRKVAEGVLLIHEEDIGIWASGLRLAIPEDGGEMG